MLQVETAVMPVTTPSTRAPVPLSICCWLADHAHHHPSLASPSVSPASQPRPPPTFHASPSQTLVILIVVLIFKSKEQQKNYSGW